MENKLWKSNKDNYVDALNYIVGRRKGDITSFKTPWGKFNDAGVDGLEWNSMILVGGRPGSGKTALASQITRESKINNPKDDIRILDFQFEMLGKVGAIREFSAELGQSYKHVLSAEKNKISDDELNKLIRYSKKNKDFPRDLVEDPKSVPQIKHIIETYMNKYSYTVEKKTKEGEVKQIKKYTKTIITLDHTYLVKESPNHSGKTEMLYDLGEILTQLKRKYPIIFIILSQLGRNVDTPERNENGKIGNYITEADVFGGDALTQHADIIALIDRPGKRNIKIYGPERFIIPTTNILVVSFTKVRNGDPRISFFEAKFEEMKIMEANTPDRQGSILKIKQKDE